MTIQSLAEAKAELEKEEPAKPEVAEIPEVEEEQPAEPPEEKAEEPEEEPSEEESKAGEGEPSDDWTKGDDDPPAGRLSDSQAAAIRKKYEAKAKAEKEKASKLEEELAEIKKKLEAAPAQALIKTKPVRESFKTDAEFQEALIKHAIAEQQAQSESAFKAQQAKAARDAALAKIAESTDAHYTRAAALAAKSNITAEAYQAADLNVRQAFEAIRPEQGDALVDGLIHILGPGSERVFYKLGVNSAKRAEAVKLLQEDGSGLRLTAYLAKLNAELSTPMKRETKAPDPAPKIQGDKSNTSGATKQKRDFDEAMAKGNTQKAWNIKQAAKKTGLDTASW